jgi:hypothetical protein
MEPVYIQAVALDIYGTVLATDDYDNSSKPRKGLDRFFDHCDMQDIKVIATSDGHPPLVRAELSAVFSNHPELNLFTSRFHSFLQLDQRPLKDFSVVLEYLGISSKDLLVIGDSDKDIHGALRKGINSIRCPEYKVGVYDNFDFAKIDFIFNSRRK